MSLIRRHAPSFVSLLAVASVGVGAGCEREVPQTRLSGAGHSCLRTADCDVDLACIAQTCVSLGKAPPSSTATDRPAPIALLDPSVPQTPTPAAQDPSKPYVVPVAVPANERDRHFPLGDDARSRQLNTEGLRLRGLGDHNAAVKAYIDAIKASPANEAARYNAACEAALLDRKDLKEVTIRLLEDLLRQGTRDSRIFVAEARFDSDFRPLAGDSRFQAIIHSVALDPSEPFGAQLCDDPARIVSLIDPARGLYDHLETEFARGDRRAPTPRTQHVTGRDAFAAALAFIDATSGTMCNPDIRNKAGSATLYRERLADRPDKDVLCLSFGTDIDWSETSHACLARHEGAWRLASTARVPGGVLDQAMYDAVQERMHKGRNQGLALYDQVAR